MACCCSHNSTDWQTPGMIFIYENFLNWLVNFFLQQLSHRLYESYTTKIDNSPTLVHESKTHLQVQVSRSSSTWDLQTLLDPLNSPSSLILLQIPASSLPYLQGAWPCLYSKPVPTSFHLAAPSPVSILLLRYDIPKHPTAENWHPYDHLSPEVLRNCTFWMLMLRVVNI